MAVIELPELKSQVKSGTRLLGLDVGTKTIGLALSDVLMMIASPLETIKRTKFTRDAEALVRIAGPLDVGGLVIGLPVSMDGTEGPRCQSTRQFGTNLLEVLDLPIVYWDERLSTAAVERMMISEMDMTRKRRKEVVDKAAAAYILQGALDAIGRS